MRTQLAILHADNWIWSVGDANRWVFAWSTINRDRKINARADGLDAEQLYATRDGLQQCATIAGNLHLKHHTSEYCWWVNHFELFEWELSSDSDYSVSFTYRSMWSIVCWRSNSVGRRDDCGEHFIHIGRCAATDWLQLHQRLYTTPNYSSKRRHPTKRWRNYFSIFFFFYFHACNRKSSQVLITLSTPGLFLVSFEKCVCFGQGESNHARKNPEKCSHTPSSPPSETAVTCLEKSSSFRMKKKF